MIFFFKPAVCVNKTYLSYFERYNILCVAFKCVISFYRSHKLKKKRIVSRTLTPVYVAVSVKVDCKISREFKLRYVEYGW